MQNGVFRETYLLSYMITFSTKGTARVTFSALGSRSTPGALELEESAANAGGPSLHAAHSTHHRLPVFVNLKDDPHTNNERDTPHRFTSASSSVHCCSSHSFGQPSVQSVLSSQTFIKGADHRAKRTAPCERIACGGFRGGLPGMLSATWVDDEMPLELENGTFDMGGAILDLFGLQSTDRLCPFHQNTPLWLVPHGIVYFYSFVSFLWIIATFFIFYCSYWIRVTLSNLHA